MASPYYVTESGTGAKDGSYAAPYGVAEHNAAVFAAGDVIYLLGTITSEVVPPSSGTAAAPIVYRGDYTGNPCSLQSTGNYAINRTDVSYVTVYNVQITSAIVAGIGDTQVAGTVTGNVIDGCRISGIVGDGANLGNGSRTSGTVTNLILRNSSIADTWNDGVYWGADTTASYVVNCDISDYATGNDAGDGIQFNGSDCWAIGCRVIHPGAASTKCCIVNGAVKTGGGVIDCYLVGGSTAAIGWDTDGGTIIGNTILDVNPAAGTGAGISCNDNAIICGNVIDNVRIGLYVRGAAGTTINCHNNTILSVSYRGIEANTANAFTLNCKNNVVQMESGGDYTVILGANVTSDFDYNYYKGGIRFSDAGTAYATFALWQALGAGFDANGGTTDPNVTPDYYVSPPFETTGLWIAGVRLLDDLPQPLHPPIGAKCRRDWPGRSFGVGGGAL